MRHRRAERCLLRAEMALEAGFEEDAREALDEAARLHSDNPKLAVLRSELDARTASAMAAFHAAQQASRRQRTARVAATLVLFLAIGAAAFWITRRNAPVVALPVAVTTAPPAMRALDESPVPAARTEPVATAGEVDAQPLPPQEPAGPPEGRAAQPEARASQNDPPGKLAPETATPGTPNMQEARRTGPDLPAFNPQFAPPRPVALPASRTGSEATTVVSEPAPTATGASATAPTPPGPPPIVPEAPGATGVTPGALDRMGERLAATNAPVVEKAAAPAEKPAPPEDPAVREEPRVRAVLSRYEAAYSGLDAAAAQAVWPSVDGRSLARAFDTLQSQRVALGRCSVQVQGTRASAECNGTMTWTPKVGGGTQTASRRWQFELYNGNGTWQITRADVR